VTFAMAVVADGVQLGRSVDKGAVVARGKEYWPCIQAKMVVSQSLMTGSPRWLMFTNSRHPRPRAIVKAHRIAAVGLVPGQFRPRVLYTAGRLVEVVIEARILVSPR
jgi:hypothetical protein